MQSQRGTTRHLGSQSVRVAPALVVALLFAALWSYGCSFAGGSSSTSQDAQAMEQLEREQDAKTIKGGIELQLDPLVSPSADELQKMFQGNGFAPEILPEGTPDQQYELLSHLLRKFSYVVKSVDVRGSEATATVEVSCLDASQAVDKGAQALSEGDELEYNAQLYNSTEESDRQELAQHVYNTLYAELDSLSTTKTSKVKLQLTKNDNEWLLHQSSLDELLSALWP